jgi:hypothetical protein
MLKSLIFSSNKLKNIKNSVIPGELLTNPTKTLNIPNIITTIPNLANLLEIISYDIILCFRQFSSNLYAKTAKASAWTSLDEYTQNQENSITLANYNAASPFHAKLVLLVIRSRATNKLESLFEASSVSLNITDQDTEGHVLENPYILVITDFLDTAALELTEAITTITKASILVSKPGARPKPW